MQAEDASPKQLPADVADPFSPSRRLLYRDYAVLCSAPDGTIEADHQGLYEHDTRILSRRRLTVDGAGPWLVSSVELAAARRLAFLGHRIPGGHADGPVLPQDLLEIRVETCVGAGMRERITVTNRSGVLQPASLGLDFDADFVDVQEAVRDRRQTGTTSRTVRDGVIELVYDAERGERRFTRGVRVTASVPATIDDSCRFAWRLALDPGISWSVELVYEPLVDGDWRTPMGLDDESPRRDGGVTIFSEPPAVGSIVNRAIADLTDLRNRDLPGDRDDAWVPNAGVPTYTGLFGRDSLTAGWQSGLAGMAVARGALNLVAHLQARDDDPFRDAEPGRLIHEVRRGPLSELDMIPQRAYYGTQTTPAMFVLALSEAWHWTGDRDLLRRHRETAERALRWAAERGDRDGDGFLESFTRSPGGLRNQAWKDSNEAIRYPDGRNVDPPLATVEEQAFHILALERMAEILVALDGDDEAERCLARAEDLRSRWHEAFWLPDLGYYALALDADKRPVRSIASNPGHALGAGIVPPEAARVLADRMLEDDLFSGWGIRTLSAAHPSYNPFAYHLGTVWPVEQATFALGFKRYGLDEHLDRLVASLFDAAGAFRRQRLPEVLSGLPRSETILPVPYPEANSPQAWTASATIQLLQVMLGIYPFAPLGILALVRPRLPATVRSLVVRDMRIGDATVSLRFERNADGSAGHEVLEQTGHLIVLTAPPPQDVHALSPLDAIKAWAIEHVPGRDARALRIALGLERPDATLPPSRQ